MCTVLCRLLVQLTVGNGLKWVSPSVNYVVVGI